MKSNGMKSKGGVNFGVGGAGVTYAYGHVPLDKQVDHLEGLVKGGILTKKHLNKSVALVCIGVNDYSSFNFFQNTLEVLPTFITTVVDGIALNLVRIQELGIRHIMVATVVPLACMPYTTFVNNFTKCVNNQTLSNETIQHNSLLEDRVKLLNKVLPEADIIIINQTKALETLFHNGQEYGHICFVNPFSPCCTGGNTETTVTNCGVTDDDGKPMYHLCKDPSRAVIFDFIHPTQAAWKTIVHLYSSTPGFTHFGPKLNTWIKQHDI
ncbi:unnamed protein product [Sphagnum troendelagicum]|uniref:GDSL esterase/lipase n=1 Tax=Sphagnum jensenii TaxID=128206 RepID=A0ABP0WY14_9BRYO